MEVLPISSYVAVSGAEPLPLPRQISNAAAANLNKVKTSYNMIEINVTNRAGQKTRIEAADGEVLMNVLRDNHLDVEATCGGCCSCATCHIYVDQASLNKLEPQSESEKELLEEMNFSKQESRLSCEIQLSARMSGMQITIAPSEG